MLLMLSLISNRGEVIRADEHQPRNGLTKKSSSKGFPGGAVVKNLPANAGDTGSSPGPGRSHMLWSN